MGTVLNNDNTIWFKHIHASPDAMALLRQFPPGAVVKLEIEGVRGEWERMATGRDGRATPGLKPVGETRAFWKSMETRRGEHLRFRVVNDDDPYLSDLVPAMSEWSSEEDEAAFRDL